MVARPADPAQGHGSQALANAAGGGAKGSRRLDEAAREELAEDLRHPELQWIESSTGKPGQARYVLALADISTRNDRAHWVARGRMRLTDRRDGHVVA
jgi:hypothetical protein